MTIEETDWEAVQRRRDRRKAGHLLRELNRVLMPGTRWATCGDPRGQLVAVKDRPDGGAAQVAGIETCGSPWACTCCAGKIRAKRAEEIDVLARSHLDGGDHLTFVTLTVPHVPSDSLEDLLGAVRRSWKRITSGGSWQKWREQWGEVGYIRTVEVTYGRSGWHPHIHVLAFHQRPVDLEDDSLAEFRAYWAERWSRLIDKELGRTVHQVHGVDAVPVIEEGGIGAYLGKLHLELTRADLKIARSKTSRTPWQVAADAAITGDRQDMARWVEFCEATKGYRSIIVCPQLRELYGKHATADQTDEELAAEQQDGTISFYVDAALWRDAKRHRSRHLIASALDAYETHGITGFVETLTTALGRVQVREHRDGVPVIGKPNERIHRE